MSAPKGLVLAPYLRQQVTAVHVLLTQRCLPLFLELSGRIKRVGRFYIIEKIQITVPITQLGRAAKEGEAVAAMI
jgi:hypothetical protein